MINESIFKLIEKSHIWLSEEDVNRLKNEGGWKEPPYDILNEIGVILNPYGKSSTIPVTNFFRKYKNECWKGNRIKIIENYLNKIYSLEDEKELYTRIIKDYFYIIKLYIEAFDMKEKTEVIKVPGKKINYRFKTLSERKKIIEYPFIKKIKINKISENKTVQKMLQRIDELKSITNEDILRWVEYMMLWGTLDGCEAEFKVMDFLKEKINEIRWRWSDEKEDSAGVDIVGEANNKKLFIQVKLVSGARMAFSDIDFEKTLMIYVKKEDSKFYLVPKEYGEKGLIGYFLRVYCDFMKKDFSEYIRNRKIKV